MSLVLILIRHAKSDWGEPGLRDHDRPLNGRGQRDAPRIGAWLAREGHVPEEAAVSSALRTRLTWAAMADALPGAVARVVPELYEAAPETILGVAKGLNGACVAVVGHNPGIGMAMHQLAAREPEHARWKDIPTGAVCVLSFDGDVSWGAGEVLAFATPHEFDEG